MARTPAELRALFETTANQDALLDTADEVWVRRVEDYFYVLHIWQSGRIVPAVSPRALPRLRVRERVTAWNLVDGLAIEREVYDEAIVVRRTHLNGPIHVSVEAPGTPLELPPGFREVSPWAVQPFGRFHRQYVRWEGEKLVDVWVVSVAGAGKQTEVRMSGRPGKPWHEDPRTETCDSLEAAIARAEDLIAEHLRDGFELRLIELLDATRSHETPPFTKTADPHDAVDAAVARIRALTRKYPRGHFLVEELDPVRDAATLAAHGHGEFFVNMHEEKFNRWADLPAAKTTDSSFDHFLARYGTLTWIIASQLDDGLPMFYCGNVSGGGWCCLELGDIGVDLADTDLCHPGRGYAQARVFHGGWGGTGYLFDTRVASKRGEHPIYEISLDGPIDHLMPETPVEPDEVEAFGHWLEREVHEIASELEHRLPTFQG